MLDPKIIAELEQVKAAMMELYPSMWKQLYDRCIEEGFDKQQAFKLVLTYILSQNPHGIQPPGGN